MKLKVPESIQKLIEKFQNAGFEIYIVGGGVRDLLVERPVKDWDFTTNATPEDILSLFPDAFYDNKFGTVGIPLDNQIHEVTTFRREIGYSDKRHPDKVVWGETLEEDLSRRDFTINAIALRYAQGKPYTADQGKPSTLVGVDSFELIDPFGGQKDLKEKIIRAVGDPEKRFREDALRMIRAIRIATELGFVIESKTFQAIKDNASLINQIAKERIRDELLRILQTDYPADGIAFLLSTGLLEEVIPELVRAYGVAQAKHHIYDVWTHSLLSLKNCPSKDPIVRMATLLHDIGKPVVVKGIGEARTFYNHEVIGASIAANLADRLRLSNKQKEKLVTLIRWHQFTVDERQTDSAIRRFIKNVGKENLQDMLDLRVGDRLGGGARETSWRLEKFKKRLEEVQKQPFSVTDLKVNGSDVMEVLNIPGGPKVGQILNQLFLEIVEDQKKNEREYLLKRIKEIFD
ncbi:MAG: CCA tRNA nucleotidyltransferase [bacterium]|nr:CCA tRNA nucleotidyltransferase [bacterium]